MASRGEHLLHGGKLFVSGRGIIGRVFASSFARVLDAIDQRLVVGGIHATLPDGTMRRLGFRGPGPEPIVKLNSWYALVRLARSGSIGWYQAWAKGEWTSPDPVPLFALFTANARTLGDTARAKGSARMLNLFKHRRRDNDTVGARENIAAHYDLGNDFYAAWLDPTMSYSSARFASDKESLETAQKRKVALLLDRLDLKPGQRLLEIGCGWGSLAIEAARRGVAVVGLTLSSEQKKWADARSLKAGVFDKVEIRLADYRDVAEQFDAIASVEMVEAVGERWWGAYLDCIARNLKSGGRAALQFISIEHDLFESYARNPDFIQAYIFPGGMLLDEPRFEALAKDRGLSWDDRDGFGLDYAQTLKIWRDNYDTAVASGELKGFSADFHDLWRYYLMYCEGGFRGGAIDVAQVTLTAGKPRP